MVHEVYRLLCFEYKVVSIEYFMDHMSEYEIIDVMESLKYTEVNSWEQTRLQIYTLSQIMSKKKLKIQDVMVFPWDEVKEVKNIEPLPTEISDNDIARLKARAENMIKLNNI